MELLGCTDEYPWICCQGSGSSRASDQDVPAGNSGLTIRDGRPLGGELPYPTRHKSMMDWLLQKWTLIY